MRTNKVDITFDAVVIGAGVVGLAIARQLSELGLHCLLVEASARMGTGISSRSSEVIHSGIYYPANSLKAKLCVKGNARLYQYCETAGVPHRRIGKLIVATTQSELDMLATYIQQGVANGIQDLRLLDEQAVRDLEPAVCALGAVLCPSTGIIDSHALMRALLDDFEDLGGVFVANTPMLQAQINSDGKGIELALGGRDPCTISAKYVLNAAGLGAQAVAKSIQGIRPNTVPALHYAIGHYYALATRAPFQHLIYPVASGGGLGVHLTLDLAGQARFGPDISWRDTENYAFDDTRGPAFAAAIRRYWPAIAAECLIPAYTGIRPKLWGPNRPDQDFMIQDHVEHGIPGLINLFGIESPGLTSCLTIATHVAGLLGLG